MTAIALAVLLATLALSFVTGAAAVQDATSWFMPQQLFDTIGRASEAEVVADPSGTVHAFWAYGAPGVADDGPGQSIYYACKKGDSWSEPVDILISPGGRIARTPSVVADTMGYLYVAWSGGNAVYYSRAYGPEAGSARGWHQPVALTSGVGVLEPAIAIDELGALYVVWTQTGSGLMFARSEDAGQSWSVPKAIFTAGQDNELARWGRIATDKRGRLHVVLTHELSLTTGAAGRSDPMYLYYLSSGDRGESWSEPFLITPEPDFGEVNVATFADDLVHLVWNGRAGRHGRYHRWSADGGQSWSDVIEILAPADPLGTGGLTGFPALVTDSTGALHMISATGGGDYYFLWKEGRWSLPSLVSPGLDGQGVTGKGGGSLEQPSIAISEGNRLHVVFHDGFERIWYTTCGINAPYTAPVALPTPTPEVLVTTGPAPRPSSATSMPTDVEAEPVVEAATPDVPEGSVVPAAVGAIAAAMLVVAVVGIRLLSRGRR